ncbi:hypothetical protein K439DRAFT_1340544 [Ramaria rubella]|nr:hypothetical protein K439DRAFT_1340544 [Ramaria rubella]
MSDNFKLPTDQYYIRNENDFAGRNRNEDKSLNPKGVFCPTDYNDPELASTLCSWKLEALPNGRYRLKARGAPTGVQDGLLYAFLEEKDKAEEWVITRRHAP